MQQKRRPLWGAWVFFAIALMLSGYFTFAAVQGSYGVFERAEIEAEAESLQAELDVLAVELARLENLTHRLSDTYLDLDLLDEQARSVLGMIRTDEIVIR
ncbi:MAG: septum formation initiator family protein [Thalassovita sp.]